MSTARSWFVHLLAIVGVVIWLEEIWPDMLPPDIRFFTLAIFGGILFLALRVVIEELTWRVRLKRCLRANEGVKPTDRHGSD
jgi:hypothetical protein